MPKTTAGAVPAARRKRRSSGEIADRILDAASGEFERSGFAGATTAAIARRADVTEAQIFRLFGSKRELFHAAVFEPLNRHFADFHARHPPGSAEPGGTEALAREYIGELQDFTERHSRMLMSLIVASAYSADDLEAVGEMDGLNAYFERGAAMVSARAGALTQATPELMVRVSFAAVVANVMFGKWLFPPHLADDAAVRKAIADFVLHGIGAGEDRG